MGFKEVKDLSTDVTVSLGGVNKKTNKPNPSSVEGYYLGRRQVPDKKKKSGFEWIYTLQTQKGTIGVWGKTDLNKKMEAVTAGCMVRLSNTGKVKPTPNGDMQLFKVEVDSEDTVDVSNYAGGEPTDSESEPNYDASASDDSGQDDEPNEDDDQPEADEATPTRASAPRNPARTPSAAQQSRVQGILNSRKASA